MNCTPCAWRPEPMSAESTTSLRSSGINLRDFALEIILLAIIGFLCFFARGFGTWDNFLNILRNASTTGIIAFGMTFVIIAGEIDLSVGSAIAFHGCLLAVLTEKLTGKGYPVLPVIVVAVTACFALAILTGMFTGWVRHRFSVPTFITMLAWMAALR